MLIDNNEFAGTLTITADVPDNTEMPPQGYFAEIEVMNWHGIRRTDSRIMSDATVPSMVELIMADGSSLRIWPDGTIVVQKQHSDESWSLLVTTDGILPNPYRH
jgi:hypothetical protein